MKKPTAVLMILLFAALANAYAQSPTLPTLPQKTVSLALPTQGTSACPTLTTGSNCIRTPASGNATDFQNALNAATCGDTIVLAAGSTYSGNFTVPQTTCSNNSGWMVIKSSAMASLPASGNRVAPSDASNMATISTPNVAPALAFLPSSNHWRVMGIKFTTSYVSTVNDVYNIILMGFQSDNATPITVLSQFPSYVILDRSYVVGLSNTNTSVGFRTEGSYVAMVDSYCDEIHYNSNDSQCIKGSVGPGPYLIQNNFLQASSENILYGGDDPSITNLVPSDITIIGNLLQKNLTWRGQAAPYNWSVKNLFELKNAQRLLLDGNVFQYDWAAGQAMAILIRAVNQSGGCPWCIVQDITVTHNLMQHVPGAIAIANSQSLDNTTAATQRVLLQNNLILDSSGATWGGQGILFQVSTNTSPQAHDWIIDHNTGFSDYMFLRMGDSGTVQNFQFTNNIGDLGTYGIFGAAVGEGTAALSTYATGYVYDKTVILDATSTNTSGYTYPAPQTQWSTWSTVGFTSYTGTYPNLTGNFQLTSGSAYHNAGTDGKDIGVWDWTCLNSDSTAARAGQFVPGPGGCALSGTLLPPPPPTNLNAVVQ